MMNHDISLAALVAIGPQLLISIGIVLSLLLIAWRRSQQMIAWFTQLILLLALLLSVNLLSITPTDVTILLKVDRYSEFTLILICAAGLVVTWLSKEFLNANIEVHDEYYVLLLLVVLGASILVVSAHYASLFLGFELLSISFVGLVGYARESKYSVETSFKYLILSATASSIMLLGIALIYSQTGNLAFVNGSADGVIKNSAFYGVGMLLFISGIAFKLSLVPFHFWTPDVYQGAPTPVTMLMATVSKVAMFTVLMKCLFSQDYYTNGTLVQMLTMVAILSMVLGNVLALKQSNIKRLFGYSSIAHMGYLLIVLIISSQQNITFAWQSAQFYLSAYVLASLSLFTAVTLFEANMANGSELSISNWQGLFWQNKLLALLVIVAVLSFAGIPLTMGFIGKFYILSHATQANLWWLIAALIIGSGIALSYYLRVIFILFDKNEADVSITPYRPREIVLVVIFILAGVLFGLFPDIVGQLLI